MPTTSILITTYKRPHLLKLGLESLSRQEVDGDWDVIVLNDGIQDDSEKICKEYSDRGLSIRYVFTGSRNLTGEKWRIPGYALNIGAKMSTAKVIILSCAEMYHLDKNSIQSITQAVLEEPMRLAIPQGRDDTGKFLETLEAEGKPDLTLWDRLPELNVRLPFVMGLSRKNFVDIGGYDEDFTGIAFDDDDIVGRLLEHGCHYRQLNARVVHLWHPRGGKAGQEYTKKWSRNRDLYRARQGIVYRNLGRDWGVFEE